MGSSARLEAGDRSRCGFTFIELLVVVAMLGIFSTIAYVSMVKVQSSAEMSTSLDRLVLTIHSQRMAVMLGEGGLTDSGTPRGVYFEEGTGAFTTFVCTDVATCEYIPLQSTNTTEHLENSLIFSEVDLPNNQIIFTPLSGEVVGYSEDAHSISIRNTVNGTQTTLTVSRIGTVQR